MINHHPDLELLKQFVGGSLPASVSVVIASHVEMCQQCADCAEKLTDQAAEEIFEQDRVNEPEFDQQILDQKAIAMMEAITCLEPEEIDSQKTTAPTGAESVIEAAAETVVEIEGQSITLPRAMRSISLKPWTKMGKLSRARLNLDDDNLKSSLLHIRQGGSVPCHTHKGFEITLLLQGSFDDEMGTYQKGDFIWLDAKHCHQPTSPEGCVCLTVSSAAMQFTRGASQLLNPLARFIY